MRRSLAFAAGLLSAVALALLMAPTGGFPSRPRFQSVGVGMANTTTGTVKASALNQQLQAHGQATGASNVAYVSFHDSAATRTGYIGDADSTAHFDFANEVASGSLRFLTGGVQRAELSNPSGSASRLVVLSGDTSGDAYAAFFESDGTTQKGVVGFSQAAGDTLLIDNQEAGADVSVVALDDIVLTATDQITMNGVNITPSDGTYTGAVTGCTTDPAPVVEYQRIGRFVTVWVPSFTCTSNATTLTITGAPVAIRPAANSHRSTIGVAVDNGVNVVDASHVQMSLGGVLTFGRGADTGGWTNANSKGASTGHVHTYRMP